MEQLWTVCALPLLLCGLVAFGCWLASVVTREYSWVDRLWSVLPVVYTWLFAWKQGFGARVLCMALLVTAWGARLTYNFARKGGYARGGEDYRWAELRRRMPPWAFQLFNVFFVAGYQNVLIFLFTLPTALVASERATPLGPLDLVASLGFALALLGETVSDQQQWTFQERKRTRRERGEAVGEAFLTTGLFRYSRHPNFFFEQAQWWLLTLFPAAAGQRWLGLNIVGAVLLTLLFDGSTRFTESITARKYPMYEGYQRRTSRWLPWFPRPE